MVPYWTSKDGRHVLYSGDCLEILPTFGNDTVDAIVTDLPFFKVKNEAWDRQWSDAGKFIEWIDENCKQWQRVLKANGSLYCFASPKMAARVECKIAERLDVLNRIRWVKGAGWHNRAEKKSLRSFLSPWEEIIFAEHYGADSIAKGESGYTAKCDELRGFIFEPLRAYLASERDRAGWTTRRVAEAFRDRTGSRTVTGMAGHWFERVQWTLPTTENYQWLRQLFNGDYLRREYEELRREYEELRREYEELRRPFSVTADVPYTDVWTFATVAAYPGKHVCEKPLEMIEHIVRASTRENATVLDSCAGSGTAMIAAHRTGRRSISIELSREWCDKIAKRFERESERTTQPCLLGAE